MTEIHKTAIISEKAIIGKNVAIGPYSVIGDNVKIADNVKIFSHVIIDGNTSIDENCEIFPFTSIGLAPQDKKYQGEDSKIIIGKNNTIREHVTINPGTKGGGMLTKIGDDNLIMIAAHIAHDCIVGNNVILANNVTLAGHVKIEDYVVIGGLSAVHQFVRIGKHAMIGGMSGIEADIIPYGVAMNDRAYLAGINIVGLKRRNYNKEQISEINNFYNEMFAKNDETFAKRIDKLAAKYTENPDIMGIIKFISDGGDRAICKPK